MSAHPGRRPLLVELAVLALAVLVLGAVAGALWAVLWTPPEGVAYGGRFYPLGDASRQGFSVPLHYLLLTVGAGLLGGIGAGAFARRAPMLPVLVLTAAAFAAAVLAAWVGYTLGPPDADRVAKAAEDLTAVRMDLSLPSPVLLLALPVGALAGHLVTWLSPVSRASSGVEPAPVGRLRD